MKWFLHVADSQVADKRHINIRVTVGLCELSSGAM